MFREFRAFIARGNLVDIAVAFVLGAAFGTVVTAFTEGIVTPIIGRIFSVEALQTYVVAGDIEVGRFVAQVLNFIVVGFAMFLVVKAYNGMKARTEEPAETAPPAPAEDIVLLREIRDSLRR